MDLLKEAKFIGLISAISIFIDNEPETISKRFVCWESLICGDYMISYDYTENELSAIEKHFSQSKWYQLIGICETYGVKLIDCFVE